jgi:hypothetical protein
VGREDASASFGGAILLMAWLAIAVNFGGRAKRPCTQCDRRDIIPSSSDHHEAACTN